MTSYLGRYRWSCWVISHVTTLILPLDKLSTPKITPSWLFTGQVMSHINESLSRILEIWNAWASFDPWFPRPSSGNENPSWLEIFGRVFQVYLFWLLRVVERTWARHERTMRWLDRTLPFPLRYELRILVFRLRIRDAFVPIRPSLVRISIFAENIIINWQAFCSGFYAVKLTDVLSVHVNNWREFLA